MVRVGMVQDGQGVERLSALVRDSVQVLFRDTGGKVPLLNVSKVAKCLLVTDQGDGVRGALPDGEYADVYVPGPDKSVCIPARVHGVAERALAIDRMGNFPTRDMLVHTSVNLPLVQGLTTNDYPGSAIAACYDVVVDGDVTSGRCHTTGSSGDEGHTTLGHLAGVHCGEMVTIVGVAAATVVFELGSLQLGTSISVNVPFVAITLPTVALPFLRVAVPTGQPTHLFFRTSPVNDFMAGVAGPLMLTEGNPNSFLATYGLSTGTPFFEVEYRGSGPHVVDVERGLSLAVGNVSVETDVPLTFSWVVDGGATALGLVMAYRALCLDESLDAYLRSRDVFDGSAAFDSLRWSQTANAIARGGEKPVVRPFAHGNNCVVHSRSNHWPDSSGLTGVVLRYGRFPFVRRVNGAWPFTRVSDVSVFEAQEYSPTVRGVMRRLAVSCARYAPCAQHSRTNCRECGSSVGSVLSEVPASRLTASVARMQLS